MEVTLVVPETSPANVRPQMSDSGNTTVRRWPWPHPLELALIVYGAGGLTCILLLILGLDVVAIWTAFALGCVMVGLMVFRFTARWDFDI
jgi:hypothetical protein